MAGGTASLRAEADVQSRLDGAPSLLRPDSSADEQLAQDVGQDPAVSEVRGLGRGVYPDGRHELTTLPVEVDQGDDLAGQLRVLPGPGRAPRRGM